MGCGEDGSFLKLKKEELVSSEGRIGDLKESGEV